MQIELPDLGVESVDLSPETTTTIVGIDVAKAKIDVARGPLQVSLDKGQQKPSQGVKTIVNRRRNLIDFLEALPAGCALIVESTGKHHLLVCELAFERQIPVFVVNPFRVSAYRKHDGQRAKTDVCDALLLVRFGREKLHELRRFVPLTPEIQRLQLLVRNRSLAVKFQTATKLGLAEILHSSAADGPLAAIHAQAKEMCRQISKTIQLLEEQIKALLEASSTLNPMFQKLLEIPGVGLVTASSVLCALQRGEFQTAESFIAYLGLDPVARDSGQSQGRRRLSKKGDPQVRSVLFMSATACTRCRAWKAWIDRYKARGLKHPQVACIVARRIATIAWCLIKKNVDFSMDRMFSPPGQASDFAGATA